MRLGAVDWLWLLWLLPALVLLLRWSARRAQHRRRKLLGAMADTLVVNGGAQVARAGLLLGAVAAATLALARPAWGVFYEEIRSEGVDVVVLLDVSRSMLAEDAAPNRLERARIAVGRLVDKLEETGGHRIGLVAFAGTPSVRCPLTVDYGYYREALARTGVGSAARGGTLIGDAIRRGLALLESGAEGDRALIVLTDGEDQESYPVEAAKAAAAAGVTIYTVGIGDAEVGTRIPVTDERGARTFVEHDGAPVTSRLDEATLLEIARLTGGAYVPAGTRTIPLGRLYAEAVAGRRGSLHDVRKEKKLHERFQWWVALAMVLALSSRFAARRPEEVA